MAATIAASYRKQANWARQQKEIHALTVSPMIFG
jgi:hypothetical protein